jgi:fermentation-respiration switch protein FrsA (DUF1100 family)
MANALSRMLLLAAIAYGCYAALLFLGQRVILYPGRMMRVPPQPPAVAGMERLWLETGSDRIEAWFLPGAGHHPERRQPLLIVFHGNGEVIDFLPEQMAGARGLGMGVLLVEYPGYGRSGGAPSEARITATAVAAFNAVARRHDVDPSRIVIFGRSLGGGAACALARRQPVRAVILQSPFTSVSAFSRQFLVPGFLVRDRFDNRAALTQFQGPVLIFHGRHDDIIPFRHGEELARIAHDSRLVELDCAHNDCPPDPAAFWRLVGDWLREQGVL